MSRPQTACGVVGCDETVTRLFPHGYRCADHEPTTAEGTMSCGHEHFRQLPDLNACVECGDTRCFQRECLHRAKGCRVHDEKLATCTCDEAVPE